MQADEEERKIKLEAEKRKKEADRKKKQQMMAGGGLAGLTSSGGGGGGGMAISSLQYAKLVGAGKPNFVLPNKKNEADAPLGPKPEPGQSPEEAAALKAAYMDKYAVDSKTFMHKSIAHLLSSVTALVGGYGTERAKDAHQGYARADRKA